MSSSPSLDTSMGDRVKLTLHVTRQDRHWLKAAASLDGMSFEEWLYWIAAKRALDKNVPKPFARDAVSAG